MVCKNCGQPIDREHRFCPGCAASTAQGCRAVSGPSRGERAGAGLRVSRYFDPGDGPPHTRVSVYHQTCRATAVVALDDATTLALAQFLLGLGSETPLSVRRRVLDRVVERLTAIR